MMLTEAQAKEKWCPFARTVFVNADKRTFSTPSNRLVNADSGKLLDEEFCVGSRCMAWRWAQTEEIVDREGFCGMAGKP